MQKVYLGVEGGATKSTAILEKDGVLIKRTGKALNYDNLGEEKVKENLKSLLKPLLGKTKGRKIYAVLGLAGLDTKKDAIIYSKISKEVLPKGSIFKVVNDAKVALEVLCPNETKRILVISGTGSNVYGENGQESASSIGWGFLLGDEGSGFETGLKALKAATQSWDGRAKKTKLEQFVLEYSKTKDMEHLIPKIYSAREDVKTYIASFAPVVDRGIEEGDEIALSIREEILKELLLGLAAVVKRLNIQKQSFKIGLVGSNWRMPQLKEKFEKAVLKEFPLAEFSKKQEEGALGAILLAKRLNLV